MVCQKKTAVQHSIGKKKQPPHFPVHKKHTIASKIDMKANQIQLKKSTNHQMQYRCPFNPIDGLIVFHPVLLLFISISTRHFADDKTSITTTTKNRKNFSHHNRQ